MLRYIVGISIITVVLMLIRYLSNGKILKKHQYAMWLIIPVSMILLPFYRIGVPIPEELSPYIPISEEVTAADDYSDYDYVVYEITEVSADEFVTYEQWASENALTDSKLNTDDLMLADNAVRNANGSNEAAVNVRQILKDISITVSAILIALLIVYNVFFVLYCRRNSKFIGRDPISGLKIYGISHKGAPFLLFNRIYVDKDFNKVGKYKANNELYVDNISGRLSSYIICHEACHFKHCDFIWVIVRYLVLAINWYNPLIWAAFILSGRDCELACDEEVVRCSEDNSSVGYATSLLEMMRQKSKMSFDFTVSTGMRGGFEIMKKRIVSITNPAEKSYKTLVVGMAALIVVSSFFVLEPRAAETTAIVEPAVIEDTDEVFDEDEGISSVEAAKKEHDIFFYRDSIAVKGRLFLPEGEGPFKTVIMCGAYSSAFYEDAARRFTDYGYAAVVFEFSNNDKIDTMTQPDGRMANVMLADFNAVLDGLRYLPDVDRSNIYLWGHSVGGFISAYEGMKKGSEIKGMILVEPYLTETQEVTYDQDGEGLSDSYINLYYMFSYSNTPSIFIAHSGYQGTAEMNKAAKYTPDGKFVVIDSEDSLFEDVYPMVETSVEAIRSWDK